MIRLAATGSAHTSTPKTLAVPASGRSSPTAIDRAVVLPAPLGPTSPKKDPRARPGRGGRPPSSRRTACAGGPAAAPAPARRRRFEWRSPPSPHNLPVPLRGTLLLVPEER